MGDESQGYEFAIGNHGAGLPTVSLCMIVKNEADVLAQCLKSVQPLVDEINLVDTGSTDDTIAIGARYGAQIKSIPWENDFSKARNVSLKMATTDWILVLDADEVLAAEDLQAVRRLMEDKIHYGFVLEQRTYGYNPSFINWIRCTGQYAEEKDYAGYISSPLIRLFRNDRRIAFEGRVHELVESSFQRHQLPFLRTGIAIHHYGKVRDPGRIQQKARLYLHIGQQKAHTNPEDPKAQSELGAQYLELKDYPQAAAAFQKCIALNPSDRNAYTNLGVAYLRQGELGLAERALSQALALDGHHTETLFNLGAVFLHQRRYCEAERCFEKIFERRPDYGLAYGGIGMALLSSNRVEEAIPYLFKAADLNPGDPDTYSNLAWAYIKLVWPKQALAFCRRALKLAPEHENALKNHKWAKNLLPVSSDRKAATQINKEGESLFLEGRSEAARKCFQQAVEHDPYHQDAWNNLGVLYWVTHDQERALACFLRAYLLDPEDPDTNDNLLTACSELGRTRLRQLVADLKGRSEPFGAGKRP